MEKQTTRIDKNKEEITKSASYILQFMYSARFMASSLSILVNNLSEGIHGIKCKCGHDDKKCETCGIRYEYCDCFLKYAKNKDDLIEYKCLYCNKSYQRKIDEKLKERFFNTNKFCNNDFKNFILSLRKGVYPYEYMEDWEKFIETLLPEKEDFHSPLNVEDITDADCMHAKRICKDLEIKNLRHHDFYVQDNTLLLADVFENFRSI